MLYNFFKIHKKHSKKKKLGGGKRCGVFGATGGGGGALGGVVGTCRVVWTRCGGDMGTQWVVVTWRMVSWTVKL